MKEKPILRGVDLDVPEGSMVAIVGPSGCGKTTLLKLIARFYDVDDGAVRIGGVDVRDMTTEDLFARVSFVFQDVYLFNDTLRNNVLMANPDASEEQLRAVADLAGMTRAGRRCAAKEVARFPAASGSAFPSLERFSNRLPSCFWTRRRRLSMRKTRRTSSAQ